MEAPLKHPAWFRRAANAAMTANAWLCEKVDLLLPAQYRVDGNRDFLDTFIPSYVEPRLTIYEVGGGKHPYFRSEQKKQFALIVVGLDIDGGELSQAPDGAYDRIISADICSYRGKGDADLVICQAVLEHVKNTDRAFAAVASILRPGGSALIFVPSRNALFARLNLLLSEEFKQKLLFFVFPTARDRAGFKSYYNACTPKDFRRLAVTHGLEVQEERLYFMSYYFFCFFPAYLLWRIWLLMFRAIAGGQAAETFCMALKKSAQ